MGDEVPLFPTVQDVVRMISLISLLAYYPTNLVTTHIKICNNSLAVVLPLLQDVVRMISLLANYPTNLVTTHINNL